MQSEEKLDRRYRILREIGQGSEGKVFLVYQESTMQFLAAKEILKEGACFSREGVEVWKRLDHPLLPAIRDVIETEDTIWIIMEYIDGIRMSEWVRLYGTPGFIRLFRWGMALSGTLLYLHEQNPPIIFGDLKPDNILIRKDLPVLVDLGSSYMKGSRTRKTGTEIYQAEQEENKREEKGDLVCLGKTFQHLLSKKTEDLERFVKGLIREDKNGLTSAREGIALLRNILYRRIALAGMLLGSALGLGFLGYVLTMDSAAKMQEEIYQYQLVRTKEEREDAQRWEDLICMYPEQDEGYQECMDEMLSDLILEKEEYYSFLKIWEHVDSAGKSNETYLRRNLSGYARIVYKMGLSCWYFYQEREGIGIAMEWFRKLEEVPPELRRNSEAYLQLGEYQNKTEIYKRTGEDPSFFIRYAKQMQQIDLTEEAPYFTWMLYKEELLFYIHYLAELQEEGMTKSKLNERLEKIECWMDSLAKEEISVLRGEGDLFELIGIVKESGNHIFGEKGNGRGGGLTG